MTKRQINLKRALSTVVLVLFVLSLSISVTSKTASARTATLNLFPTQGLAGSTVVVNGQGFGDSSTITISFNGQKVQTTYSTGFAGQGLVYGQFTVPASTTDGTYNVTVQDTTGDSATVQFIVGASGVTPTYAPNTYQPTYTPPSQNGGFWSPTVIAVIGVIVAVAIILPVTFMLRSRGPKRDALLEREPMPYRQDPYAQSNQPTAPYNPPASQYGPSPSRYSASPSQYSPSSSRYSPSASPTYGSTNPAASRYSQSSRSVQQPSSGKTCPHCHQIVRGDYNICPYCYKKMR